jgi:hypothetical protein
MDPMGKRPDLVGWAFPVIREGLAMAARRTSGGNRERNAPGPKARGVGGCREIASLDDLADGHAHPVPGAIAAERDAHLLREQMLEPDAHRPAVPASCATGVRSS